MLSQKLNLEATAITDAELVTLKGHPAFADVKIWDTQALPMPG